MEKTAGQGNAPNPICDLCSHPMRKFEVYEERYAFRALFTHYVCDNCKDLPKEKHYYSPHTKLWTARYKNFPQKHYISKFKCNICEEFSMCTARKMDYSFIKYHSQHLYTRIIKLFTFYYNYYITDYYFSLKTEAKNTEKIREHPEKKWSDIEVYVRKVQYNVEDISIQIIFSCGASILAYDKIREIDENKKVKEGGRKCICCNFEYLGSVNSIEIYEHFVKCLEKNKKQYTEIVDSTEITEEEKNLLTNPSFDTKQRLYRYNYNFQKSSLSWSCDL